MMDTLLWLGAVLWTLLFIPESLAPKEAPCNIKQGVAIVTDLRIGVDGQTVAGRGYLQVATVFSGACH